MQVLEIETGSKFSINLSKASGEESCTCPKCSHDRKKRNVKCFYWNHEKLTGFCQHCGGKFIMCRDEEKEYKKPKPIGTPLSEKTLEYFKQRGINERTINRFNITENENGQTWICFNYFNGPELVNIKYRNAKKEFRLESGCKLIPYNVNAVRGSKIVYVVEGEFDALTMYECGFKSVISVPNGAHKKNNNLEYLDDFMDTFDQVEEVVILTDGDEPGITLRNELSRRFGRERCSYVIYPEGCKDSNDVLMKRGKNAVVELIEGRKEFPLEGISTVKNIEVDIDYIFENGYPKADRIDNELDNHITWRTSEWTVITGSPGSGKSDVLDQITLALSKKHGWKFGIFSPENAPYQIHFWKLAQKYIGKMRHEMSRYELEQAKDFLKDRYYWVSVSDLSLDILLAKAKELIKRKGIKGFVIDPWNQIDHIYPSSKTETQYISEALSKITSFVTTNDIHMFLVAHPTKSRQVQGKLTLYDISGSAHFYNKCYNGLVIMRDYERDLTLLNIEKVKFWFVGKAGKSVEWYWDKNKGTRFFDLDKTVKTVTEYSNELPFPAYGDMASFESEKPPF